MLTLLNLAFVLICLILVVLVLLQHGKGGGLSGMLGGAGGSEAFIGPGGASKMAKITVMFAIAYFVLAMGYSFIPPGEGEQSIVGPELQASNEPVSLADIPVEEEGETQQGADAPEGGAQAPVPPQERPAPPSE
jgi:preprotein translocase subunit SecG